MRNNSLILVADNSKLMRVKLRNFLENDGYKVVEAEDGSQVLSLFERLQPDIILMGCVMPVLDGFSACTRLQKIPGGARTPVIMITALEDDKAVDLAFDSGATDYITKPIHWAVLRQRVRRMLQAKYTEVSLDESEAFAQSVINHALDGIITIDIHGSIRYFNPASEDIFGYKPQEAIGKNINMLIPKFYCEGFDRYLANKRLGKEDIIVGIRQEVEGLRKDSTTLLIELTFSEFKVSKQKLFTVIMRDITDRKRAEEALRESEERFRTLTENTYDLISELNLHSQYLYLSPNYKDVLGYEPTELIGKGITDYVHPEDSPSLKTGLERVFENGASSDLVYRYLNKNGEIHWFESAGRAFKTAAGETRGVFISRDITERKRYEETIRHQAFHDSLTGLPNRLLFKDRLILAMSHAKRNNKMLAVLFLDLDRFKLINDTLGHDKGDHLLQNTAQRLKDCVREDDTVARLGGDEFTILLPEINQAENAAKVAHKILETIRQPVIIDGHELFLTTSIGIVLYPGDGEDADVLLKNADTSMYRAKEQGRNNYQLYTPAMNAKAFERLAMENSLRRALEREEFTIYYQPKVNIDTKSVVGMEALVRWMHPERGMVSPGEFIPIAEESGLIVPIGEWVLRNACAQNKAWQDAGLSPIRVAVNLSARQFQLQNLVKTVSTILEETGLEPRWLELEITESVAMQNADYTVNMLHELKEMGIELSIDDFGTGYSSLSYLKRFPIHKLKIDKSFVNEISDQSNDKSAIASTVIVLGQSLKLGVIAEGVETQEQLDFLQEHHCSEMQGFLFGKPIPPQEIEEILKKDSILDFFKTDQLINK